MEKIIEYVKNSVREFEYPLANSMSDVDLGDIFTAPNRCFLVSWMLKLLDIDIPENNTQKLGQHLYNNGFCTKEEQLPFMTATLDISEQFKIIQRIFKVIEKIRKPISDGSFKQVSLDDIQNLSIPINLFPTFGEIKVADEQTLLPNPEDETETENYEATSLRSKLVDISNIIENIQLDIPNMKNFADNYQQDEIWKNNISDYKGPEKGFHLCNEYLTTVCQFLKDINDIEEFEKYKHDLMGGVQERTPTANFEMFKDWCEEICNILRIQKS